MTARQSAAKGACRVGCGHPLADHENGECMHLCDCAWPAENDVPLRVEPPRCATCFTSGWYGSRQGNGHHHCDCGRTCVACPIPPATTEGGDA